MMNGTHTNAEPGEGLTHAKLAATVKKLQNMGTTWLGRQVIKREVQKGAKDALLFGTQVLYESRRRWFNPLRYVLGEKKLKRIDPRKYLVKVNWADKFREIDKEGGK